MKIRCISIDDEPLARKGLKRHLSRFNDFELIAEYSSAEELLASLPESIDVMFVDIEMPRCNGFELLQKLPQPLPMIVFITAYDQYAIQAFESQALDYVLKPIKELRFEEVINRIRNLKKQQRQLRSSNELLDTIRQLEKRVYQQDPEISVKTDEGYFQVKLNDVFFLEAAGDHVALHFESKQLITRATLKTFIGQLSDYGFSRVHKSYIVNLKKISQVNKTRFGDYKVVLTNDSELRVSRTYKSAIADFLDNN